MVSSEASAKEDRALGFTAGYGRPAVSGEPLMFYPLCFTSANARFRRCRLFRGQTFSRS